MSLSDTTIPLSLLQVKIRKKGNIIVGKILTNDFTFLLFLVCIISVLNVQRWKKIVFIIVYKKLRYHIHIMVCHKMTVIHKT